jgi:hypothetical protein
MAGWSLGSVKRRAARRRISAVLLAVGVIVTTVSGQAADAATWTGPSTIPSATTYDGGPALARYDGLLYAAWQGKSSPYHIWYSAYNAATGTWSHEATEPVARTNSEAGPSLAVYHGDLYAFWQSINHANGQPGYHIWYASFNGTSWSPQAEVPSALVTEGAAMGVASYGGDLYLSWLGQSSAAAVWYSAFNGTSWTPQASIPKTGAGGPGVAGEDTPLAAYGGRLYVSWEDASGIVEYATFNGTRWSAPVSTNNQEAFGPALAVAGSRLYESWIDSHYLTVDWASFNGTRWTKPKETPWTVFSGVTAGPAIAGQDGDLYAAWVPDFSPSPIDYSVRS